MLNRLILGIGGKNGLGSILRASVPPGTLPLAEAEAEAEGLGLKPALWPSVSPDIADPIIEELFSESALGLAFKLILGWRKGELGEGVGKGRNMGLEALVGGLGRTLGSGWYPLCPCPCK